MFNFLLGALWFGLPVITANMIPSLYREVKFLDIPIDFGKKYRGKRIFGAHKTIRGFVFGIGAAIITVWLQQYLAADIVFIRSLGFLDYATVNFWMLGLVMGFGTLAGDAIFSFFKRQKGVAPGKPWMPWDQIDAILGVMALYFIVYGPIPFSYILFYLVIGPCLHLGFNYAGWKLGLKKNKW